MLWTGWRQSCRTAIRQLAGLRGELVPEGLLDLGGFYGLHPSLTNLHAMYGDGELLPVHAVAGPTRVRSHFEAQDCLESGADSSHDQWLAEPCRFRHAG